MDDKKLIKALEFGEEKMECIKPIEFGEGKILNIRGIEFLNEEFRVNNNEKVEYVKGNIDALLNIGNLENQIITKTEMFNNSKVIHSTSQSALLQKEYNIINGILHITELNGNLTKICNFRVEALSTIIEDDGISQNTKYVMRCYLENDTKGERVIINSGELNEKLWIARKLDIKYTLSPNKLAYDYFKEYLSEIFSFIKPQVEYTHVGWRFINNRWCYLNGAGAIGSTDVSIRGDKNKIIEVDYNFNRVEALNITLNMLEIAEYQKTVPMFLYTHLGVLKEIFKEAEANPEFSLWLEGLTGSRKTSVAKVFFNIFNRSNDYISATFKDTLASLEEKSFQYKDSLLIVDDFFHSTSKSEWNYTQQTASEILRRFGDNFSKSRLDRNMNRGKEYPPRGMLVITGELTIKGESTVSRYVTIGIEKNDINLEVLKYHQENPKILSTHLYYFIQWVSNNSNKIIQYIKDNFRNLRNENQGKYRHGRLEETYTIYQLICTIFLSYCLEVGIIDECKKQVLFNNWCQYISEAILINEKTNLQENPAIMYLQALQQLICDGEIKLRLKEKNGDKSIVGYEDDEYYYLSSEVILKEIIKYWKKVSIEFTATSEMITKALDVLGAIKTAYEGGKVRRTLKISGDNRRFLIINKSKMKGIVNDVN